MNGPTGTGSPDEGYLHPTRVRSTTGILDPLIATSSHDVLFLAHRPWRPASPHFVPQVYIIPRYDSVPKLTFAMSDHIDSLPSVPRSTEADHYNEKGLEIQPVEKEVPQHAENADPDMRRKLVEAYGRRAEEDEVAPASDISLILDRILEMSDEEATNILVHANEVYSDDPNFSTVMYQKIQILLQGYKVADMEHVDWSFELRSIACMIYYHSPYPEVRAVTDPFDDPTIPVETLRCYVIGMCLMAGSSAINTFFSPRQPSINLSGLVLQCILAPCGQFCARFLPKWTIKCWRFNIALNPGPWTFKEQILATIMVSDLWLGLS